MRLDVVVPDGNEEELLAMAEKLGFKELVFLYTDKKSKKPSLRHSKLRLTSAILIDNPNDASMLKQRFDYVMAPSQRKFFESSHIDFFIDAESDEAPDLLNQKRGGLDDAICQLVKDRDATIVFDLSQSGRNTLARFMQNASLCRKHKIKSLVVTLAKNVLQMRSSKDLDAFTRAIKLR